MQTLSKQTLSLIAALGLSLALTTTFAGPKGEHEDDDYGPPGWGMRHGDPEQRMERMQQRHAQRMQQLEQELKLTPEQKPDWNAFLDAQTKHHQSMLTWHQQHKEQPPATAPEFFNRRVEMIKQHLTSVEALAQAASKFYAVLTKEQKTVMDKFFAHWPGRGPGGGPGPGPRPGPGPKGG